MLGDYPFDANDDNAVTLSSAGDGYVIADALKIEPVGQLTTTPQSGLYFVHSDHLGTPKLLTDSDGATVWEQHTTPFGEVTGTVATGIENIQSFPGQYRDGETGYSYNYFRDYDPTIGRYVQSDPIGLNGGLNTYAYVQNIPTQLVDPYGLKTQWCQRPLGNYSGENGAGYPLLNHQFMCVTLSDGTTRCDSLNNPDVDDNGIMLPSPGAHSLPERDNEENSVCTLVDGDENQCFENCVLEEWSKPLPDYAIGPLGDDCQEYTHDIYYTCTLQCGYQNMR
ncbi:MAG: RHS repeat-associated core domain-containing protein [Reinekea sp.]